MPKPAVVRVYLRIASCDVYSLKKAASIDCILVSVLMGPSRRIADNQATTTSGRAGLSDARPTWKTEAYRMLESGRWPRNGSRPQYSKGQPRLREVSPS